MPEIGEAMDLPKIQLNNYFSEFITENKLSRPNLYVLQRFQCRN